MRIPTPYETYLRRIRDYYKIKNMDQPEWVKKAREYYVSLRDAPRFYAKIAHNMAIPKLTMEYLSNLGAESLENLPKELIEGSADIRLVLMNMYSELLSGKDKYFINEWTLTKLGRRKMKEFVEQIPSTYGIMPPKCEFTNVPDLISFSSGGDACRAEYELCVILDGSRICLRNGNDACRDTEYIDFTERFLDEVIPLMQWENFEAFLHKKNGCEERDASIYRDFRTVLVEVCRGEFDLALSPENAGNVFMRLLMLVWEEYGELLAEKDLILPWFYTMGLIKCAGKAADDFGRLHKIGEMEK